MTRPAAPREPISEEEFGRSRRKACRRVASVLVRAMAETDTSLDLIAAKVGRPIDDVRACLQKLIDGQSWRGDLDFISDFALAMAAEIDFQIVPAPAGTPLLDPDKDTP